MAVFNLVTRPYPTITDTIQVNLYKNTAPQAVAYSQSVQGPTGQINWTFNITANTAYTCRILRISGTTILEQLDVFTFAVGNFGLSLKRPIMLQVGFSTIPGDTIQWAPGSNTVTIPDFVGWDVQTVNRDGFGLMRILQQSDGAAPANVSYDVATGQLTLLTAGDTFQQDEVFTFVFSPRAGSNNVDDTKGDVFSDIVVYGTSTQLTAASMGKKIIIEGQTTNGFLTITLPPITSVVPGRLLHVESGPGGHSCMLLASSETGNINFPLTAQSGIYFGNNEMLQIYRHKSGTYDVWRVHTFSGNFCQVGELINEDAVLSNVANKIALDGSQTDYFVNARLYYSYVLKLPPSQVCSFADWPTGNNSRKFSTADANGVFYVPDRRNMFARQGGPDRIAGSYQNHALQSHKHEQTIGTLPVSLFGRGWISRILGKYSGSGQGGSDRTSLPIAPEANTYLEESEETRPVNVAENRYIRR